MTQTTFTTATKTTISNKNRHELVSIVSYQQTQLIHTRFLYYKWKVAFYNCILISLLLSARLHILLQLLTKMGMESIFCDIRLSIILFVTISIFDKSLSIHKQEKFTLMKMKDISVNINIVIRKSVCFYIE